MFVWSYIDRLVLDDCHENKSYCTIQHFQKKEKRKGEMRGEGRRVLTHINCSEIFIVMSDLIKHSSQRARTHAVDLRRKYSDASAS